MSTSPHSVADPGQPHSRLPDSVWESIITRLRSHHRASLRGTSKKFRDLVNLTVTKIKVDPSHSEDALQWQLHRRFPRLEHFEVMKPSEVDCFTDQTVAQLALKDLSTLPSLTSLNLEHCTQLTVAGMAALALACGHLRRLVIPQVCQVCMSDSMLLVLARLPDLSKLRVQCCKHCNEVALACLSDLRRLTALELEDYGQALRQVTQLTGLTSLRSVMVWSDYTLDMAEHPGLGLGPGQHHPGLGLGHHPHQAGGHGHHHQAGAGGHAPEAAPPLPPMGPVAEAVAAAVAALHLEQQGGGGGAGGEGAEGQPEHGGGGGGGPGGGVPGGPAPAPGADAAFAHQLQLTEQVLSNIFAGKAALLDWVTGMTGLTHVDIQRVDVNGAELQRFAALPGLLHLGVGDLAMERGKAEGLQEPLRSLPSVTKLVSHNISNEAALRTTFPALRALSCDAADSGLRHIAELTGLVNLFLWTSPSDAITDGGLDALSSLAGLETFRLEGSDTVSDAGWVRFVGAHSGLTRVDLVKCPHVTDIGLILSMRQLSRLQRISFVDCPAIDTRALAALLACCPRLEHVELQDCPAMSQAAIRSLLASVSRVDLDVVLRRGGSTRVIHGSR